MPVPALPAVLLVLAVAAAACSPGSGESAGDQPEAAVDEVAAPGQLTEHTATVDDLERTWSVYAPAPLPDDGRRLPVMLVLHGTGDTGAGIRRGIGDDLVRHAESGGFVIAYVDGHENNWNECRAESDWPAKDQDLDDVGLMREVVDGIREDLGTDVVDDRVFALGFSSGGHMAIRLGLEAPDLVDGVAPVAANLPAPDNLDCEASGEPVTTMFVQGREDPINPIAGGEVLVGSGPFTESRGEVVSARRGAEWFAENNGIDRPPESGREGDAELSTWEGEQPVRLVVVDHSGHSFPTDSGRWGNDGGARYDAPGAIWEFLDTETQG